MANSNKLKTFLLWTLTVLITLGSVVYQRMTGPTHPVRGKVEIAGQLMKYKLLTSHDVTSDAMMEFNIPNLNIIGVMKWRRYKSHDEWTTDTLTVKGDTLVAAVAKQPPASLKTGFTFSRMARPFLVPP